jgi:hypothetical protein
MYLLKISKGGDSDCRHGKPTLKVSRSVGVSGLLSFWSYPLSELVTSVLTRLSVYVVFQVLCDQESTAATDTTELPELLV